MPRASPRFWLLGLLQFLAPVVQDMPCFTLDALHRSVDRVAAGAALLLQPRTLLEGGRGVGSLVLQEPCQTQVVEIARVLVVVDDALDKLLLGVRILALPELAQSRGVMLLGP